MTRYQGLAAATVLATLALIALGAVVRTTGSGLGCPDWPLCHGGLLPPAERAAIVEYAHRSAAAITGALVVATAAVALLRLRADRPLRNLAIAALPLLAFQAWVGKETVERELPPEIVTLHLGTALVLLAVLTLMAAFAFLGPRRRLRRAEGAAGSETAEFLRLALSTAALTAVALLAGSYVVGAGATAACSGWPGCPEAPAPFLGGLREQHVLWLHRLAALAAFVAALRLAWAARGLPDAEAGLRAAAWALGGLYAGQVLLGAVNVWTGFTSAGRAAHLALGASIWGLCVLIAAAAAWRAGPPAAAEPARA